MSTRNCIWKLGWKPDWKLIEQKLGQAVNSYFDLAGPGMLPTLAGMYVRVPLCSCGLLMEKTIPEYLVSDFVTNLQPTVQP